MDNLDNLKIDFENWYYEQEQEYATGKVHPEKIWKWFNESFPHERVVIQKNTEIFKMQLHQTIDLQDEEGFAIYGYLPYKYVEDYCWDHWAVKDVSVTPDMLKGTRKLIE